VEPALLWCSRTLLAALTAISTLSLVTMGATSFFVCALFLSYELQSNAFMRYGFTFRNFAIGAVV
jgi:hypothetical protein